MTFFRFFAIHRVARVTGLALLVACTFPAAPCALAQTESVLYSFTGGTDGSQPNGSMVQDKAGNLYGTTFKGGTDGYGTVFELSPVSGGWQETVLHSFANGHDGANPYASVVFGPNGNLYGSAGFGGNLNVGGGGGWGVVFELSRVAGGGWKETVLHTFSGGKDGAVPQGLAFDTKGNLFGLADQGGSTQSCGGLTGCGTVFKLTPQSGGGWKFSVIHIFTGGLDGGTPALGDIPITDANGNLYATTITGGSTKYCLNFGVNNAGCGVVFKLSPTISGGWKETVLYRFFGFADGAFPTGALVLQGGNLYGSASAAGTQAGNCSVNDGCGVVFELTPTSSGVWNETPIHALSWSDGVAPGGLVADGAGNLYGATAAGASGNSGTIFEMARGGGGWTFSTLHVFQSGGDGQLPSRGVIMRNSAGDIFGATIIGGSSNNGSLYEITP